MFRKSRFRLLFPLYPAIFPEKLNRIARRQPERMISQEVDINNKALALWRGRINAGTPGWQRQVVLDIVLVPHPSSSS